MTAVPKTKYLYQFGDGNQKHFVIPKGFSSEDKYSASLSTGLKSVYNGNNLQDGEADLLFSNKSYKEAYSYDIAIPIGEIESDGQGSTRLATYTIDTLNSVCFDVPKTLFSYSTDINGNVERVYYAKARCVKPPEQMEYEWNNEGYSDIWYNINLKLQRPFWYDCTSQVKYYNYELYQASVWRYGDNKSRFYSTGGTGTYLYGDGTTGSFSSLSSDNKNLLLKYWSNSNILTLVDRFFDFQVSIATNYIINGTYNSNTKTQTLCNNVLGESNARNDVYLLNFTPLLKDQTVTIKNLGNNSGIKITWISSVPNTNNLIFNSYLGKVYDALTKTEIGYNSIRVERADSVIDTLFFSPIYHVKSLNPVRETLEFTISTGNNITLSIDILPTYN